MWTKDFWKAVPERMLRGAAVAVAAVWFSGDVVFDTMSIHSWGDIGSLAVGGAFGSLLLALIGNTISGNGPAFTNKEVTPVEKANGTKVLPPGT